MLIASFDPGLRGAAALYDAGKRQFLDMVDIPVLPDGETRNQVDGEFIGDWLERWEPDCAVIENVQVAVRGDKFGAAEHGGERKSNMSPSDAFRFGLACGVLRGVVRAYRVPFELLHPRTWTRHFGLKGGDKRPHVAHIKQIAPSCLPFVTLAKHDGRADAGLMAICYADKRGML